MSHWKWLTELLEKCFSAFLQVLCPRIQTLTGKPEQNKAVINIYCVILPSDQLRADPPCLHQTVRRHSSSWPGLYPRHARLSQRQNQKAPVFFPRRLTAKSLQLCPTLCDPIDGSWPGSPVPGILQARTLEWVAISLSNVWKWKVKVKSLSCVRLLATPWTAAHQAPPSMGFPRQEYWSGVPLPSPRRLTEPCK